MKAALTVWEGRVSPVFDVSREVLVLTIEDGAVGARSRESINTPTAAAKIDRLVEMGIQTLVCGAISEPLQYELAVRGVKLIGFVAGDIDEVVESLLAGTLPTPLLSMPGCRRQNRFRGGRGGGSCGGRRDVGGCRRRRQP
jgi:predicted Fe-Mo cluster-binding NifX family protein